LLTPLSLRGTKQSRTMQILHFSVCSVQHAIASNLTAMTKFILFLINVISIYANGHLTPNPSSIALRRSASLCIHACKAFHFYTRNTRNAMKHAHYQLFLFLSKYKQLIIRHYTTNLYIELTLINAEPYYSPGNSAYSLPIHQFDPCLK
jgi:hypothetical protein